MNSAFEDYPDDLLAVSCPMCNGRGGPLGRLGALMWWRCQDCGIDFSTVANG
jgi:rubredoxin